LAQMRGVLRDSRIRPPSQTILSLLGLKTPQPLTIGGTLDPSLSMFIAGQTLLPVKEGPTGSAQTKDKLELFELVLTNFGGRFSLQFKADNGLGSRQKDLFPHLGSKV